MGWVREEKKLRDEGFRARREEKWGIYLGWAAGRFLSWAEAVEKGREEKVLLPPIGELRRNSPRRAECAKEITARFADGVACVAAESQLDAGL